VTAPTFRTANPRDFPRIRALLEASQLPTADLADSRPEFVLVEDDSTLVGVAGLQCFGDLALLRSVAVAESRRGAGFGDELVRERERFAIGRGVSELVLLTQTAEGFFARHGFQKAERSRLRAEILATAEFRSLCPDSAACMTKRLDSARQHP